LQSGGRRGYDDDDDDDDDDDEEDTRDRRSGAFAAVLFKHRGQSVVAVVPLRAVGSRACET